MTHPSIEQDLSNHLPFWTHLAASDRELLCQNARTATFRAGERVQGPHVGCVGAIFLKRGRLRTYMLSEQGREITLFHVLPGECCVLAASCILPMITFDITLDAAEDSELIVIDSRAFGALAERDVHAEAFTYRQATERFSDCMWVMQQVLFMGLDARLAIWLIDEAARLRSDRLAVTHDEIARHLGSAREAVSRMLKYFANEGLVRLERGTVIILDKAHLRELTRQA